MKKTIVWLVIIIILVGIGWYFFARSLPQLPNNQEGQGGNQATTTEPAPAPQVQENAASSSIGTSVEGREIVAYNFGTGTTSLLFIGGIHGGYEWNTVLVAYQLMDYLAQNPSAVPANVKVTVIPVLNPDGLNKVVGTAGRFAATDAPTSDTKTVPGRFNAHNVDLNRNFECDWQATAKWQDKDVSGGSAAFSEPESQAAKSYVETTKPKAIVTWYSAAGGVFSSNCHTGVLAETDLLTKTFATASGYSAHESFDFYATTGDMTNWFAKSGIPAISVLLTNHTDTEWTKNQKGIDAILKHYAR
jgi:hypothetical protein